ncbi:MAG: prolipoprotein diacylglyceryl transferase [Candidatus Marinimicrobia bacterium]|nr:prolipoprotein diacylglyceryl transferase [Candidatus Neomarinimicrobiota bacterium]MCF7829774.1 prolipoprotein diacylglyceryl transferase [Candidatus Neomarinimicrobiota bacterium]MCF7881724.1 prolipoprotein diacylglyceryl transferase [Candidatus Neomarinimicrobiota bacterium]
MNDFWQWWQHLPSKIDPVLLSLGHFKIHWYGLMYIVAFAVVYLLIRYRLQTESVDYNMDLVERFFTWAIIGVMVGGRLGYVLFYTAGYYLAHPIEIVLPFSAQNGGLQFTGFSGMSYHGGMLGVAVAFVAFARKYKVNFFKFTDLVVPAIPLGFMFGRIGCFINGTLYGRPTDVPWGMYFPMDATGLLHHPSQLYEALFEGLILFLILWAVRKKRFSENTMAAWYLMGYGFFRVSIEFFRQPDAHLGEVLWFLTTGQLLSLGMVAGGVALFLIVRYAPYARSHEKQPIVKHS